MRENVVETYEEDIVKRTHRVVHVVESVNASIEAWHGGRRIAELGGWTSTARAVREAGVLAQGYGVDEGSSLRIQVREVRSRQKMLASVVECGRGDTIGRSWVVSERHVFDAVRGDIPCRSAVFGWQWRMPVAFRIAQDCPDDLASFFRVTSIGDLGAGFFYEGYGFRDLRTTKAVVRDAAPDEMPEELRKDPPRRTFGAVKTIILTGTAEIQSPEESDDAGTLRRLVAERADVDIEIDYERDARRIDRQKWVIWSGMPACYLDWTMPPRT